MAAAARPPAAGAAPMHHHHHHVGAGPPQQQQHPPLRIPAGLQQLLGHEVTEAVHKLLAFSQRVVHRLHALHGWRREAARVAWFMGLRLLLMMIVYIDNMALHSAAIASQAAKESSQTATETSDGSFAGGGDDHFGEEGAMLTLLDGNPAGPLLLFGLLLLSCVFLSLTREDGHNNQSNKQLLAIAGVPAISALMTMEIGMVDAGWLGATNTGSGGGILRGTLHAILLAVWTNSEASFISRFDRHLVFFLGRTGASIMMVICALFTTLFVLLFISGDPNDPLMLNVFASLSLWGRLAVVTIAADVASPWRNYRRVIETWQQRATAVTQQLDAIATGGQQPEGQVAETPMAQGARHAKDIMKEMAATLGNLIKLADVLMDAVCNAQAAESRMRCANAVRTHKRHSVFSDFSAPQQVPPMSPLPASALSSSSGAGFAPQAPKQPEDWLAHFSVWITAGFHIVHISLTLFLPVWLFGANPAALILSTVTILYAVPRPNAAAIDPSDRLNELKAGTTISGEETRRRASIPSGFDEVAPLLTALPFSSHAHEMRRARWAKMWFGMLPKFSIRGNSERDIFGLTVENQALKTHDAALLPVSLLASRLLEDWKARMWTTPSYASNCVITLQNALGEGAVCFEGLRHRAVARKIANCPDVLALLNCIMEMATRNLKERTKIVTLQDPPGVAPGSVRPFQTVVTEWDIPVQQLTLSGHFLRILASCFAEQGHTEYDVLVEMQPLFRAVLSKMDELLTLVAWDEHPTHEHRMRPPRVHFINTSPEQPPAPEGSEQEPQQQQQPQVQIQIEMPPPKQESESLLFFRSSCAVLAARALRWITLDGPVTPADNGLLAGKLGGTPPTAAQSGSLYTTDPEGRPLTDVIKQHARETLAPVTARMHFMRIALVATKLLRMGGQGLPNAIVNFSSAAALALQKLFDFATRRGADPTLTSDLVSMRCPDVDAFRDVPVVSRGVPPHAIQHLLSQLPFASMQGYLAVHVTAEFSTMVSRSNAIEAQARALALVNSLLSATSFTSMLEVESRRVTHLAEQLTRCAVQNVSLHAVSLQRFCDSFQQYRDDARLAYFHVSSLNVATSALCSLVDRSITRDLATRFMKETESFVTMCVNQFGLRGLVDTDSITPPETPPLGPQDPIGGLGGIEGAAPHQQQQVNPGASTDGKSHTLLEWLNDNVAGVPVLTRVHALRRTLVAQCIKLASALIAATPLPSSAKVIKIDEFRVALERAKKRQDEATAQVDKKDDDDDNLILESVPNDHECSICMGSLVDEDGDVAAAALASVDASSKDLVRLGNCGHWYHHPCIYLWLLNHNQCPLCRREVT